MESTGGVLGGVDLLVMQAEGRGRRDEHRPEDNRRPHRAHYRPPTGPNQRHIVRCHLGWFFDAALDGLPYVT
jgi:hypothetical protein